MQGWGVNMVAGLGIFAGWFLACAGQDIPPIDDDLRGAIAQGFGGADTQMGSAGASGAGNAGRGGSGSGSGGSGSGSAGSANNAGSNAGGGAGGGGSGPVGGGGEPECDAFPILARSCGLAGCHGEGAPPGEFAGSEALAASYLDQESQYCNELIINSARPEESLLYTKLFADFPSGCGNSQMPLAGAFLTDEESECVLGWLQQFAQ